MNLMTQAFGIRADQITESAWLKVSNERYDIVANIPEGATKEQFNAMLGNLLRDRFHLRFHMDSKIVPVYALRVGKNGPKFKETARRADDATSARAAGLDAQGFPILSSNFTGIVAMPRSSNPQPTPSPSSSSIQSTASLRTSDSAVD